MKSLANTLFQKTAPSKEMPTEVFQQLMENAILEHGSDTDYYFKAKHGNYEMLFGTDGETISIDTFGFNHNKGWIELDPTDYQINAMKRKIDVVERDKVFNGSFYDYTEIMWQNGHRPSDFY